MLFRKKHPSEFLATLRNSELRNVAEYKRNRNSLKRKKKCEIIKTTMANN